MFFSVLEIKWNSLYQSIIEGKTAVLHGFLIRSDSVGETESCEADVDEKKLRMGFLLDGYQSVCSPDIGETLLHAASKLNNTKAVKSLLMSGANPCIL